MEQFAQASAVHARQESGALVLPGNSNTSASESEDPQKDAAAFNSGADRLAPKLVATVEAPSQAGNQ